MDSGNANRNEEPPRKKRRVALPTFESSFANSSSSPSKPGPSKSKSSIRIPSGFASFTSEFTTSSDDAFKKSRTPITNLPAKPISRGPLTTESDTSQVPESISFRKGSNVKQRHLTAALTEFATSFEVPLPVLKPRSRTGTTSKPKDTFNNLNIPMLNLPNEGSSETRIREPDIPKPLISRTPLRILKPPSITTTLDKTPISKPETSMSIFPPPIHVASKTPESAVKKDMTSVVSHLESLRTTVS
ncbi:hypothetical protein M422DRAFT_268349, partial [Sphaerobolus stellatus SS14]